MMMLRWQLQPKSIHRWAPFKWLSPAEGCWLAVSVGKEEARCWLGLPGGGKKTLLCPYTHHSLGREVAFCRRTCSG